MQHFITFSFPHPSLISNRLERFKGRAVSKAVTPSELLQLLDSSDISASLGSDNVITDEELNELLDRSDLLEIMRKKKEKLENMKDIQNGTEDVIKEENVELNNSQSESSSSRTESKLFTVVETSLHEKVVI